MSEPLKNWTLRFNSEEQYKSVRNSLAVTGVPYECEQAAFLFGRPAKDRELHVVDATRLQESDFVLRSDRFLELGDDVLQRLIVRAHETGTALIEAHTHPRATGTRVQFSSLDCEGLAGIGPQLSWRLPGRPYVALVFGRDAFDSLYWENAEERPTGSVDMLVGQRRHRPTRKTERFWSVMFLERDDG